MIFFFSVKSECNKRVDNKKKGDFETSFFNITHRCKPSKHGKYNHF